MEDRVSMGNDALEHIETLRRVAALASRLCLDVSGGLMTIRNVKHVLSLSAWFRRWYFFARGKSHDDTERS